MNAIPGAGIGLTGLGVCLPEHVRTNDFWGAEWRERHEERARVDLTTQVEQAARSIEADVDPEVARHAMPLTSDLFRGTVERRVIAPDQRPSDLEIAACRAALDHARISPDQVDLYLGYSQVPDYPSPANHGLVHKGLGLRHDTPAWTLDVGCASFLPQLYTAVQLVRAGEYDTVLIAVSSAMSLITDYERPSSVNSGDGAVAGVVSRCAPELGYVAQRQLFRNDLHSGIVLVPPKNQHIPWYRGDLHGEALQAVNIDPAASHVMGAHAASLCREVCEALFERTNTTVDDVDWFVCAQATAWFSKALAEAIGLPPSKTLSADEHFARFAHLVPGSAPLNLYLAYRAGRLKRGDLVLIYSPGAGFTQAAMLYRWNLEPPPPSPS